MVERRKRDGSVESRSVPRGKFQSWGGRYTGLSKIGTSECLTRVADTGVERSTGNETREFEKKNRTRPVGKTDRCSCK